MSGNVKSTERMEKVKKAPEEQERPQKEEEARQQSGVRCGSFAGVAFLGMGWEQV